MREGESQQLVAIKVHKRARHSIHTNECCIGGVGWALKGLKGEVSVSLIPLS